MFKTAFLAVSIPTMFAAPFLLYHFAQPREQQQKPWQQPTYSSPVEASQGGLGGGGTPIPFVPGPAPAMMIGSQGLGKGLRLYAVYGADGSGLTFYRQTEEPPPYTYFDPQLKKVVTVRGEVSNPEWRLGGKWWTPAIVEATQSEIDSLLVAYPDARVWGPLK